MKARELAAKLLETPDATVEVCVRAGIGAEEEYGADYLVADAIPVAGTPDDEPWVTIILGDFVCDHA